jgi:hypothetical protein
MAELVIALVIAAAVLLGLLVILGSGGVGNITVFREQFPPMSDAEFLAGCSPGTNPEVALKVRRIVADFLGVERERVHPSMRFVEDIGEG